MTSMNIKKVDLKLALSTFKKLNLGHHFWKKFSNGTDCFAEISTDACVVKSIVYFKFQLLCVVFSENGQIS